MTFKHGKIAAVGDKDTALAFKSVGAAAFIPVSPEDADLTLKRLVKEQYSVIFISESLASSISDTLRVLKTRTYPAIVPIPSASGASGFARQGLKKDIEKAIGADIGENA